MCNNWPDLPISVYGATGGLIGDTVIICGGSDGSSFVDECYGLTSEEATLVTQMSVERHNAASIVINDNTLWVTGGYHPPLASTEYVTKTGTMPGPDLPMARYGHAMVTINSTYSMVIGGNNGAYSGVSSTFYYDRNEGEWIDGPSLMQARAYHAEGFVTDEVTNEDFLAVAGGYYMDDFDSTEILQDGNWLEGKMNDTIYQLLKTFWSLNANTT